MRAVLIGLIQVNLNDRYLLCFMGCLVQHPAKRVADK